MLHIFVGEDDFSRWEACRALELDLGDGALMGLNRSVLDGKDVTAAELANICGAAPFLGGHRLVTVEGLLARFEPAGERGGGRAPAEGAKAVEGFVQVLANLPPSVEVVLEDGEVGRRGRNNPLLTALRPHAEYRQFSPLRAPRLREWVEARVKGLGGAISSGAVRLLADFVGPNLWAMASEVEKLCLYAEGRQIEEEDVRLLVSQTREASILAMADDVVLGRLSQAQTALRRLLNAGESPSYLLTMITRQFRMVLLLKEWATSGVSPAEIRRRVPGLATEFAYNKTADQTRRYSRERLKEVYESLLEADLAAKTGRLPAELVLELLVVQLARGGRFVASTGSPQEALDSSGDGLR